MKKLFDKIKKNNKGFTLVELIVVIAVLAIITVVAAPQYLQYVEKSKVGTDENAIGEIAHIAEIEWVGLKAVAEVSEYDNLDNNVQVTVDSNGCFTVATGDAAGALDKAVSPIIGKYEVKSNKYSAATITITIDKTTGVAQPFTATGTK